MYVAFGKRTTTMSRFIAEKLDKIASLQVVLEDIAKEYKLQAMAIRCWSEFQTEFGIAPAPIQGF